MYFLGYKVWCGDGGDISLIITCRAKLAWNLLFYLFLLFYYFLPFFFTKRWKKQCWDWSTWGYNSLVLLYALILEGHNCLHTQRLLGGSRSYCHKQHHTVNVIFFLINGVKKKQIDESKAFSFPFFLGVGFCAFNNSMMELSACEMNYGRKIAMLMVCWDLVKVAAFIYLFTNKKLIFINF